MTTPTDVKNQLLDALTEALDEPLNQIGFVRRKGSLIYSRTLKEADHRIVIAMDCFPRYHPGAEAHIHPMLQLALPQVNEAALALVKGDKMLLAGTPEIIVNEPIEFTAPKDKHERWFASGKPQFVAACGSIKSFLWKWVLPFFSEVSTPADFVELYEMRDDRMMKQKHWYIFVAAAYQVLGRPDKTLEVVKQHFAGLGLRKKYAPLLSSVGIVS